MFHIFSKPDFVFLKQLGFLNFLIAFTYSLGRGHICTMACVWQSEDNMQELVLAPSRLVPDKARKEVRFSAEPSGCLRISFSWKKGPNWSCHSVAKHC